MYFLTIKLMLISADTKAYIFLQKLPFHSQPFSTSFFVTSRAISLRHRTKELIITPIQVAQRKQKLTRQPIVQIRILPVIIVLYTGVASANHILPDAIVWLSSQRCK